MIQNITVAAHCLANLRVSDRRHAADFGHVQRLAISRCIPHDGVKPRLLDPQAEVRPYDLHAPSAPAQGAGRAHGEQPLRLIHRLEGPIRKSGCQS
jgi:hypothetical protein